jgi:hypothetical protein
MPANAAVAQLNAAEAIQAQGSQGSATPAKCSFKSAGKKQKKRHELVKAAQHIAQECESNSSQHKPAEAAQAS